jgi:Ca-activated chloride channel family protein
MNTRKLGLLVSLIAVGSTVGWTQSDKKLSYGILFDNTGSMRQLLPLQHEIGKLVSEKASGGKVSVFGFASDPNRPEASFAVGIECSSEIQTIQKQIAQIGVIGGQTKLVDTINSAADRLAKPLKPECEKSGEKVLVVISDGEDRASSLTVDQLLETVKESGVRVYVVGLVSKLSKDKAFITSKSPAKKAREFLFRLATESGGRIVLPKEKDSAEDIVASLFAADYVHPKK